MVPGPHGGRELEAVAVALARHMPEHAVVTRGGAVVDGQLVAHTVAVHVLAAHLIPAGWARDGRGARNGRRRRDRNWVDWGRGGDRHRGNRGRRWCRHRRFALAGLSPPSVRDAADGVVPLVQV